MVKLCSDLVDSVRDRQARDIAGAHTDGKLRSVDIL
jgi:uncharacterized protein (DUF1810 family)